MARAGPSRSQRGPQASQSQPRGSRRASRREDPEYGEEEDEEEGEAENGEEDEDVDMDAGGATQGSKTDELTRKANDLVRLALFTEHKRTPLRRDDINKKVLGTGARSFGIVFEMAQKILRKTFGMELVELRSRAEVHAEGHANGNKDDDLEEARKATGVKKKTAAAGSKTYILRSVLHPLIIEYAALTDEQILEEESVEGPDDNDNDDDDGFGPRRYGSIISWSNADQLGPIGILYVILTLILVSGRVITDMDLRANLKRLRLPPTANITFNAQSTHKQMTVDAYLTLLSRQGYIERQRVGEAGKKAAAGGKRGRASAATQANAAAGEEGMAFEWRWANRAHSEVGEMGIAGFAAEFMVERMGIEEEEGEDGAAGGRGGGGGAARERREKARKTVLEKMIKGFERSAGGNLSEIK